MGLWNNRSGTQVLMLSACRTEIFGSKTCGTVYDNNSIKHTVVSLTVVGLGFLFFYFTQNMSGRCLKILSVDVVNK